MNRTKIPWCDWTWNPVVGCSPDSVGCENCYAERIAHRFGLPWGKPVLLEERLEQPAKVRKPGRIFVCSVSDLFHEAGTAGMREAVFYAMRAAPWHTYIVLTKRPWNITPGYLWEPNWWLGVSAENQQCFDRRWRDLLDVTRGSMNRPLVRFVSVEPMLGPVWLRSEAITYPDDLPEWVIAGPETGPRARPFQDEWLERLELECRDFEIPFFDKRENRKGVQRVWPDGMGRMGRVGRMGCVGKKIEAERTDEGSARK